MSLNFYRKNHIRTDFAFLKIHHTRKKRPSWLWSLIWYLINMAVRPMRDYSNNWRVETNGCFSYDFSLDTRKIRLCGYTTTTFRVLRKLCARLYNRIFTTLFFPYYRIQLKYADLDGARWFKQYIIVVVVIIVYAGCNLFWKTVGGQKVTVYFYAATANARQRREN